MHEVPYYDKANKLVPRSKLHFALQISVALIYS